MTLAFALLPLIALVGSTASPPAARRLAIVVGNNVGARDRPPLRFAERDAGKVADLLTELGGVARDDLILLPGKPAAAVRAAFAETQRKLSEWSQGGGTSAVVLFYYSGHSDGDALMLGDDRLPFGELRRLLASTAAPVRLAIIDSCQSGSVLLAKGGRRGPAFDIHLDDEVGSTGEAILTSSAANELALESRRIGGSLFTHHLVSGLRGAADRSGDGLVTLSEAYQYAFARTVAATAATTLGTQHPAYATVCRARVSWC
jgi:uncharacterized caspase-like protein